MVGVALMDIDYIIDILAVDLIGVVPEDDRIVVYKGSNSLIACPFRRLFATLPAALPEQCR